MPRQKTPVIFVVSDGHGETAQQVVRAATMQFQGQRYRSVIKRNILTPEEVVEIVGEAAKEKAAIFYTMVGEETRRAMRTASAEKLVPTVDILGPAFNALHDVLKGKPEQKPGLTWEVDKERITRMEAIDYTLRHDDGQRCHELHKADVVLVGVSRASKSSTCFYLAYRGIRAANVPLVQDVSLPKQLVALPRSRVIGLRINVNRLMAIREVRARNLRAGEMEDYVGKRSVQREVAAANRLMEQHDWRSFDASYMAIEEVAQEVLRLRGLKGRRPW